MPNKPVALGWSVGMNRWLDETGVFHLLLDKTGTAVPACGTTAYVSGGIEYPPETAPSAMSGHACSRCARKAASLKESQPMKLTHEALARQFRARQETYERALEHPASPQTTQYRRTQAEAARRAAEKHEALLQRKD